MKESHRKDPASHPDPESCVGGREAAGEALTGAHAGQPSSCEIILRGADAVKRSGRPHRAASSASRPGPRAVEDPVHAWKLFARETGDPTGTHRRWYDGSAGEGHDRTSGMHAHGKSDGRVVPEKPPNNDGADPSAEAVEGRRSTKGNTLPDGRIPDSEPARCVDRPSCARSSTSRSACTVHRLDAPCDDRSAPGKLLRAQAGSAPGVDGVTWREYEVGLEDRLRTCISGSTAAPTGAAFQAGLHPEARWPDATAGHRGPGGQDRPTGGGVSARHDLRGGFPGLLLWVSTRSQPA